MRHANTVSRILVANTVRDLPPSQPVDIPQRENEPDLPVLHALNMHSAKFCSIVECGTRFTMLYCHSSRKPARKIIT